MPRDASSSMFTTIGLDLGKRLAVLRHSAIKLTPESIPTHTKSTQGWYNVEKGDEISSRAEQSAVEQVDRQG